MRFSVLVITDRRLVSLAEIPDRVAAILGAVPRGSVAIQIREKDLDGGALLALTRAVIAIARPAGAEVWVNDRLDVALAAEADGVHLPERGLAIESARRLAPRLKIGCSRHSAAAITEAAAQGAQLVQFGPIAPTPGKQSLGPGALSAAHPGALLVAVGGISTPSDARTAVQFGADAVAILRAAWAPPHAPEIIADMIQAME